MNDNIKPIKLDEESPQEISMSSNENKLEISVGYDGNNKDDSFNQKNIDLEDNKQYSRKEGIVSITSSSDPKDNRQGDISNDLINSMPDTLDEPVMITLQRELKIISVKLLFILNPFTKDEAKSKQIAQWDLWGPLTFIIILSTILSIRSTSSPFYLVFTVFWLGSIIIFFNSKFLGYKCSFFSLPCLLGYSLVPYILISLFLLIRFHIAVRAVFSIFSGVWSMYVSIAFLRKKIPQDKDFLILFPIGLFFSFYSLLLLIN